MTSCAAGPTTGDFCPSFSQWLPDQEPKKVYLTCETEGPTPLSCVASERETATHVAALDFSDRWTEREKRLKVIDNRKIAEFCER